MLVGSFRIRILSFDVATHFVTKWPNMPFSYELGTWSRDQQLHYGSGKIYVANILLNSGEGTQQTTPYLLDSFSRIRLEYIKALKRYCHKSCRDTDAYSLSLSIRLFYFWLLLSKLDAEIRANVFMYIYASRYASRFMVSPSAIKFRYFFLYCMDNWRRGSLTLLHIRYLQP